MSGLLSNEKYSLYFKKVGLLYRRPEIKASLEIILSVFTVMILIFSAIRPTITNIVSLQKKIEDMEVVNKKADNKISQLLNAEKQLSSLRNSLYLFDQAVPDNFSYVDSAKRLEYLSRIYNLTLDTLSFSGITLLNGERLPPDLTAKLTKPGANNSLPDLVSFSIIGSPTNVISFLKQVENMDRLASLNSVSISKQASLGKVDNALKASGQLTFYFYSEKK